MEDESQIRYGKSLADVESEALPEMSEEEEELECPYCGGYYPCTCEWDNSGATPGDR